MNEVVEKVLASQKETQGNYKSINVFKEVDPTYDLGNLLLDDLQPVAVKELTQAKATFLKELARDNAQLLFNEIWKLPTERIENAVVVKLPQPSSLLPREKSIPKPKPPTKWELYAKKKGIQKKKRNRMLWDDEAEKWKPRHGYQRTNDETNEWCIEVPQNADPKEDQFQKRVDIKKEKVAKNEIKRLQNIARNQKSANGVMSSQLQPTIKKDKGRVAKEINVAKVSTASLGKFQEKLPKEKENKKIGKKRKFESVTGSATLEKQRALDVWQKLNKPGKLDITKAVNKHVHDEQTSERRGKGSSKVKNKRFRKGKQSTVDRMKSRTLGKGKKRR